jgi:hypothetical protein
MSCTGEEGQFQNIKERREKHMLRYALVVSSLIGAILLAVPPVMSQGTVEGIRLCPGDFALCAASICTPTGGTIKVKCEAGTDGCPNGTRSFPEVKCICPIFPGPSIGDITGGNIAEPLGPGHCFEPPDMVNGMPVRRHEGIWSLYSPKRHIPQEINKWSLLPRKTAAPINTCPDSTMTTMNTFTNCFSFACERAGKINGVEVANCFCPIKESLTGEAVPRGTQFTTQAGQGSEDICTQLPVGGPFPADTN